MNFNKGYLNHLLPIVLFFIVVSIYFAPLYTGKVLSQSDNIQLSGSMKEVADYREKGEVIHWSNKEFSGLPILSSSEYNPFGFFSRGFFGGFVPKPIMMVFVLFIGFYILTQVLGVSKWLSAISALAFAFSSFNFISIEVGHDNKVLAMAFMAPVLASVILAYRGRLLLGGVLAYFSAGYQLYFGHIQITYYLLIIVLAYMIIVIVQVVRSKEWVPFLKSTGILVLATALAIGSNFSKLYSTLEYSSYSNRGGSELASDKASGSGLDKDYAMAWSSGVLEVFTVVFPYFHGGATGEAVDNDSNTIESLNNKGVNQQTINSIREQVPLYWGDQPFTQGPIYFGITIFLLFILALFVLDGPIKWWGIGLTALSFFLAMGKNLEWFNDFFFYYVPLYNKFRSVTMSFSIGQLIVPLLGVLALDKVIASDRLKKVSIKQITYSIFILGGLGIFFILFKSAFFDFKGANDSSYGFPEWLINAIIRDRKSLFVSDIIRSIIFLLLSGGAIWAYLKGYVKLKYSLIAFGLLVLIDLWGVNKRYISEADFQAKRRTGNLIQPTQADQQIFKDEGYFRVFNTTRRLDQDGITSYYHYSVGGYNAIKLQRYQDLIERHLGQGNQKVINMLNVRYFILSTEESGPIAQRNDGALGNAWFISRLKAVDGAQEEIDQLNKIDPKKVAVYDEDFGNVFNESSTYSQEGSIQLTSYHPEELKYNFNSNSNQLVVFSEIYYAPGWNAYIDGEEVDYGRVNYLLRGLEVPAGKHTITFKYEPVSTRIGNKIILSSFFLFVVLGLGGSYFYRKQTNK